MNPTKKLLQATLCFVSFLVLCMTVQAQVVAGISANGRVMVHGDTINVCRGSTIVYKSVAQGSSLVNWHFNNGTPSNMTGVGPFSITYNINGYDTTFQKVGSGAFSDSMFIIVRVADVKPLAGFTFLSNNICGNEAMQFTNTTVNGAPFWYVWDFGDGNTSVEDNPAHQYLDAVGTGTQTFPVKLVVTNANTCVDSITHMVTVREVPDASVTKADPDVTAGTYKDTASFRTCNNETSYNFKFTNGSSTIAANSSYHITWGDGSPDTTFTTWPVGDTIQHEFPAGSSTMTVRVTGISGCVGIKNYIVYVGSFPYGTMATTDNTEICEQDSLTFSLTNTAGNSKGTSYIFYINDFTEGQFFQHPNPPTIGQRFTKNSCPYLSDDGTQVFANALGAYLLIQNPCGVNSSSVVPIYVSGKPKPAIYVSDTITCTNNNVSIINTSGFGNIVTPTGGTGATCENKGKNVWSITPATGFTLVSGNLGSLNGNTTDQAFWTDGSDSLDIQFAAPGTYTAKIYIGNERCGMDSTVTTITVNPYPAVGIINDTAICSGVPISLGGAAIPDVVYHWSPAFGLSDTIVSNPVATINYNGVAADTLVKYYLQTTYGAYCSKTDTVLIRVNKDPVITINPSSTEICSTDSVTLTAAGAETYTWEPTATLNSSSGAIVVAKPLATTDYSVTGISEFGCSGRQNVTIKVYDNAIAGFDLSPDQLCAGQSVSVTNNSSNATSYEWHWGDGAIDNFANGQHIYNASGVFDIALVAEKKDGSGFVCRDTVLKQVEVVSKTLAQIIAPVDNKCAPYNLNVSASNAATASLIEWVIYDSSAAPGEFQSSGQSASHVFTKVGAYSVRLVVHSAAGCTDTAYYNFNVSGSAVSGFEPLDINVCSKDTTIQFMAQTQPANQGSSYQWFVNDNPVGSSNPFTYRFQGTSSGREEFITRLVVQDGNGCGETTVTGRVVLNSIPVPDIQVSPALVQQQPNYEFSFRDLSPSASNLTYTWTMGDRSMQTMNGQQVTYLYGDTGTYQVTLVVSDPATGCSAKDSVNVTILFVPGFIQVPNAICPGCSNQSVRKFLPLAKGLKKYRLSIYTSWGQKIFETTSLSAEGSPNVPWDGTINGKPLQQDVYTWQIEGVFQNGTEWKGMVYPGKNKPVKAGFITVIK